MTGRNNQADTAAAVAVIVLGIGFWVALSIRNATGLSFETIGILARNYFVIASVIGLVVVMKIFPVLPKVNWVLAAVWLASTPALDEWGAPRATEDLLILSPSLSEPAWFAEPMWQLGVALAIVASKYVVRWGYEILFES